MSEDFAWHFYQTVEQLRYRNSDNKTCDQRGDGWCWEGSIVIMMRLREHFDSYRVDDYRLCQEVTCREVLAKTRE